MFGLSKFFRALEKPFGGITGFGSIFLGCFQSGFGKMKRFAAKVFEQRKNGDHQTQVRVNEDYQTQLHKSLSKARREYPAKSHQVFIPDSDQAAIITEEVIISEISAQRPSLGHDEVRDYAKQVYTQARNLFAILAYLKKAQEICVFWEEGISDKHLPFQRKADKGICDIELELEDGRQIRALDGWEASELESLSVQQWYMIAPIFEEGMKHYKFHPNHVLPFIPLENDKIKHEGGYSEVFTACIHTAHHRFHDNWSPTDEYHMVAIKRLHNHDEEEFEKERSILETLGERPDASPHLIKLLATYEYRQRYHFVFPKANCNLRDYWAKRPTAEVTSKAFLWSLNQMAGIAKALNIIHNFRVKVPLEGKGRTSTGKVELSVEKGEERFGRHGDIKPENILWFQQIPEHHFQNQVDAVDQEGGILQITDFGLGRFHGRDSKTEPPPNGVVGSPTYEPPECRLSRPVSRAYDFWSLGCLYLEFATWLVMGSAAIEGFSNYRVLPSSIHPLLSEDYFYTVVHDDAGGRDAKVRDTVKEWAQKLHEHSKCSKYIHDLVDLVMNDLLIIDAKERIPAPDLCDRFKDFQKKAAEDNTYLCEPDPWPTKHSPHNSLEHTRESESPSKQSESPKKVAFKD